MTYGELLDYLHSCADEQYRIFHGKLLKNDQIRLLGVRVPILRRLAKEWKGELATLLTFPDEVYEVTFLKCAVASTLPYGEFIAVVDLLVPSLDNWATCDCFSAKCVKAHRAEFLPYVEKYLADGREFVVRYGLVTLLSGYMTEEYLPVICRAILGVRNAPYYVTMAAAWLLAEVLTHFYGEGVAILKDENLCAEVRRHAVSKACDSYRIPLKRKAELKKIKKAYGFSKSS